MTKIIYPCIIITFFSVLIGRAQENIYTSKDAKIKFFSSAPLENIDATSTKGNSAINISTGDIIFKVRINTFQFKKKLMQEHFNENYLESEKYPFAEFRGTISDPKKLQQVGTYDLTVTGKLNIHGVEKPYTTKINVIKTPTMWTATADFDIRVADHNIKIPTVVWKNIAEVVNTKITAVYKK